MTLSPERDLMYGLAEEPELSCDTYCVVVLSGDKDDHDFHETILSVTGPYSDMVLATKYGDTTVENLRSHSDDQIRYEVRALWPPE